MITERFGLTELIYDTDVRGPLVLYIYGRDGYHSGKQWFRAFPRYPDEEITSAEAKARAEAAIATGVEVRICNGSDFLVFHSKDGRVLYPENAEAFWKAACA